ncbi:MAG: antibiotic biosynthesis monooxygenase [Caldilineaceae bacterium]|nr:antibiotic biosynthesis monooxygenase [Caldilineaceae bacterium]
MAQVKAKPECVEAVKQACLALVAPSRADQGCLQYDLYQSTGDPIVFIFYESWESLEDIERHLESPHALAFDEKTSGLLAEPEEITYLQKIG